jgi:hypothetical protein
MLSINCRSSELTPDLFNVGSLTAHNPIGLQGLIALLLLTLLLTFGPLSRSLFYDANIKYSVSQNYVNINGLLFSYKQTYTIGDRLTLEERVAASLMEVYGSPTAVRQKSAAEFAGRDPAI